VKEKRNQEKTRKREGRKVSKRGTDVKKRFGRSWERSPSDATCKKEGEKS